MFSIDSHSTLVMRPGWSGRSGGGPERIKAGCRPGGGLSWAREAVMMRQLKAKGAVMTNRVRWGRPHRWFGRAILVPSELNKMRRDRWVEFYGHGVGEARWSPEDQGYDLLQEVANLAGVTEPYQHKLVLLETEDGQIVHAGLLQLWDNNTFILRG